MQSGPIVCGIRQESDLYLALGRARELVLTLGFDTINRTRIEIVILELTRNLLMHAGGGIIQFDIATTDERIGLAIEAHDTGPGIADIELAMQDGYSTAATLGAGLPGVQRLMDYFEITSEVGQGTHIRTIKWVPPKRGSK